MEPDTFTETNTAPRLISTITEGFNIISNRIYLILFPLLLDVFLWLGPHLRIKLLLQPYVNSVLSSMPELSNSDFLEMSQWTSELWDIVLNHFNLFSLLRVFPIGIPSLMTGMAPIETPLGMASTIEVTSVFQAIISWLLFSMVGLIMGFLYFYAISRATDNKNIPVSISAIINSFFQILSLSIASIVAVMLFIFPTMLMVTLLSLISITLGQIVLLFVFLILIWFLMPLVFSPHGVFVEQQSLIKSITTSIRLVRNFLPGTGLFVLTALLLYQGLNLLWSLAPDRSWITIFGIFGHAFISTSLIASSFVYYRKGLVWMESRFHQTGKSAINL
ncbi:MAG: hypothetical protein GYA12_08925 [Chloroflexi bacterium]|nr:hypothetical protein [Chloroflexota bacterium]BCY18725.1 hypothetical protein hrd7_25740 [Leptolinea sp. HRD-7]